MAEGFDMIAAEAVLQLKEQYEDMTLAAAIPFRAQAEWFDPQDQLLYRELLKKADRVVMLSENITGDVTCAVTPIWSAGLHW